MLRPGHSLQRGPGAGRALPPSPPELQPLEARPEHSLREAQRSSLVWQEHTSRSLSTADRDPTFRSALWAIAEAPGIPTSGPWTRGRGAVGFTCSRARPTGQVHREHPRSSDTKGYGHAHGHTAHSHRCMPVCTHVHAHAYAVLTPCALVHINACTCRYSDLHTNVHTVCTHEHVNAAHTFTCTQVHTWCTHTCTQVHTHTSLLSHYLCQILQGTERSIRDGEGPE